MSTFGGIVSEIPNISVDRFDGSNLLSSAYFLSHCHSDHMKGLLVKEFLRRLEENGNVFLYCSEISYHILMCTAMKGVKESVKIVSHRKEAIVEVPPSEIYHQPQILTVTVIPAGHCPGSVMFFFEKEDMKILYTGDVRLAKGDIRKMKQLLNGDGNVKNIDTLYLDTTFFSSSYDYFPPRKISAEVVCNLISEWLSFDIENYVHIKTPAIHGSEFLFSEIFKTLNLKVHVSLDHFELYRNVPEIECAITASSGKTQVHACLKKCSFLEEKIKKGTVRSIKPSALWYRHGGKRERIYSMISTNYFKVAYSSHSSMSELTDIIDFLQPQKIVPCVIPPNCTERHVVNSVNGIKGISAYASIKVNDLESPNEFKNLQTQVTD